jgi:hypothetical protein
MNTITEMAEFVDLWGKVESVQFSSMQDEIRWRWTSHGEYTSKSAYSVQFTGSFCRFDNQAIWAPMEGKHKFFAWFLV